MVRIFWIYFVIPFIVPALQISYYIPIKKGEKAFIIYENKDISLKEPIKFGKNKALFKEFKVVKRKQKLIIEWEPASPKVKKVLIFTDSGNVFETARKKVEIYLNQTKLINVYPLTSDGWGIPATIKVES